MAHHHWHPRCTACQYFLHPYGWNSICNARVANTTAGNCFALVLHAADVVNYYFDNIFSDEYWCSNFEITLRFKLPESPRWLLVNGRIPELCKLIDEAAKWNGIKLPSNYRKTLQKPEEEVKVSFAELFRGEYLRTSILMMILWYTVILLYFGITLHVNNLGGDQYLNSVGINIKVF